MAYFERFVAFSLLHEEIGKSIQKIKAEHMRAFGLHSGDALYLAVLADHPEGLSASALAKACGVDRAVISRALPDLLASGTLSFADTSVKKGSYRARISLTDEGRRVIEDMRKIAIETVKSASEGVSDEELSAFYRTLRTINQNLAAHASALTESTDGKGRNS